jgi:hypothetical protein
VNIQPTLVDNILEIGALPSNGDWQVSIMSVDGRPVYTQALQTGATTQRIDLQRVPAGMYFVQLSNGSTRETTRIIKR